MYKLARYDFNAHLYCLDLLFEISVGRYGKAVVAASRKAVQDNNIEALIKIIQVGDS